MKYKASAMVSWISLMKNAVLDHSLINWIILMNKSQISAACAILSYSASKKACPSLNDKSMIKVNMRTIWTVSNIQKTCIWRLPVVYHCTNTITEK